MKSAVNAGTRDADNDYLVENISYHGAYVALVRNLNLRVPVRFGRIRNITLR